MNKGKVGIYHMLLRTFALTLAVILLFDSGLISPISKTLSQNTQRHLASVVGMTAAVEPNGINSFTAELSARTRDLDAREASLREREMQIGLNQEEPSNTASTFILSVILFILLVLIVINYALDFMRTRGRRLAKEIPV